MQHRAHLTTAHVPRTAGCTYAEARIVHKFNEQNKHIRVVLGGTCFLTCHTFLESIAARAHLAGRNASRNSDGAPDA